MKDDEKPVYCVHCQSSNADEYGFVATKDGRILVEWKCGHCSAHFFIARQEAA